MNLRKDHYKIGGNASGGPAGWQTRKSGGGGIDPPVQTSVGSGPRLFFTERGRSGEVEMRERSPSEGIIGERSKKRPFIAYLVVPLSPARWCCRLQARQKYFVLLGVFSFFFFFSQGQGAACPETVPYNRPLPYVGQEAHGGAEGGI